MPTQPTLPTASPTVQASYQSLSSPSQSFPNRAQAPPDFLTNKPLDSPSRRRLASFLAHPTTSCVLSKLVYDRGGRFLTPSIRIRSLLLLLFNSFFLLLLATPLQPSQQPTAVGCHPSHLVPDPRVSWNAPALRPFLSSFRPSSISSNVMTMRITRLENEGFPNIFSPVYFCGLLI